MSATARQLPGQLPMQKCPKCGELIIDIKGSRDAVCRRCGFKDDCC